MTAFGPQDEYARFARLYDPLIGPLLATVRSKVTALAKSLGARRALDICCGTGAQLASLHRAGLSCTGADLSPSMLGVARDATPADVGYVLCDARSLPFPGRSFDFAVLSFALHEKPPAARGDILSEALRVTRPGGTALLADYATPRGPRARLGRAAAGLVERAAGREHHALYREFLASGGVHGLLERSGLAYREVGRPCLGAVVLAVVTA